MALYSLIERVGSSNLRAQFFKNINDKFLRRSSVIFTPRQSYSELSMQEKRSKEEFGPFKPILQTPSLTIAKRFSTTSPQLAGHKSHDHSKIWTFERLLSAALLPLMPAAILSPCQQLDTVVALIIVLHTHFGLEAIVVDYVRPILFGELAPKIGLGLLYLFSIVTFAGLLNLIYNDTGLANTILNVWKK